ncbi:MAG: CopD family protein, partial [Methylobacteriaceae bacterium]|nr:CopD family protein [Methylobacteriaceae bacterium]
AEAGANAPIAATFKVMERRLYRGIIMPAMIATWVFGLWLVWEGDWLKAGWLHGKLALVLLLTGIHGFLGASLRRFAEDRNSRSPRFWRVMNEAPALLLVGIVILVVVKPF